jgi:hypothetical protein
MRPPGVSEGWLSYTQRVEKCRGELSALSVDPDAVLGIIAANHIF